MGTASINSSKKLVSVKFGKIVVGLVISLIIVFCFIELNSNKVDYVESPLLRTRMGKTGQMTVKITRILEDSFDGDILYCKQDDFIYRKSIKVKCFDYTKVIEKNGSKFNYNKEYPNLEQSSFSKGDVISVSFQSYEYADGLSYVIVNADTIRLN